MVDVGKKTQFFLNLVKKNYKNHNNKLLKTLLSIRFMQGENNIQT